MRQRNTTPTLSTIDLVIVLSSCADRVPPRGVADRVVTGVFR